jgi:flagellar L-ring protein precursor FlgH
MNRVVPLLVVLALGCAETAHIRPHLARHREYDAGEYGTGNVPVSSGSLWLGSSRGLFVDFRAAQVGDMVMVQIDENPRATGDASTETTREGSYSLGADGLFGLTAALADAFPDLDPSEMLGLVSSSSFEGGGSVGRSSRIDASVAVRVRQVLPNGDLFVEGTKILMVNDEELHIYLSGVIRPQDIAEDDTISSSRIADAEIEITGRGDLTEAQRRGWLAEILDEITPF